RLYAPSRIRAHLPLVAPPDAGSLRLTGTPISPQMHAQQERVMRVLAATVGALLISVSYPALAQEFPGGAPQGETQQGETARTEQQGEPFPAGLPQTWMNEDNGPQGEPERLVAQVAEQQMSEPAEMQRPAIQAEAHHDEPRQTEPELPREQLSERGLGDRPAMQG